MKQKIYVHGKPLTDNTKTAIVGPCPCLGDKEEDIKIKYLDKLLQNLACKQLFHKNPESFFTMLMRKNSRIYEKDSQENFSPQDSAMMETTNLILL